MARRKKHYDQLFTLHYDGDDFIDHSCFNVDEANREAQDGEYDVIREYRLVREYKVKQPKFELVPE